MSRIVITGGPRTGKTTRAKQVQYDQEGCELFRSDDIAHLPWSEQSDIVVTWLDKPGPWIIEGVTAVRALRKWLARNAGKPCDVVYWLDTSVVPLTSGQQSMSKGALTVWRDVKTELQKRGVTIL